MKEVAVKKTIIGAILLFFGLFADIGILLFGAIYGSTLTEWQTNLGKAWTAISDNYLMFPFVIATSIMILGIVFLIKEYFTNQQ